MHDLGISVGDVTKRTGSKYYVPQVWDAEAVANNPGKFTKSLNDYIIRDKRANGEPYDLIQVEELADKIMNVSSNRRTYRCRPRFIYKSIF